MPSRRALLRTAGVGLGSAICLGLAGCLGASSAPGATSETATAVGNTTTDSTTTDPATADPAFATLVVGDDGFSLGETKPIECGSGTGADGPAT